MKVDSDFLDIDLTPEFSTLNGKTKISDKEVEIWDDGDVTLFDKFNNNEIMIRYEELEEIVRVYKLYKDRRIAYQHKHNVDKI